VGLAVVSAVAGFVARHITDPAARLAAAAESVAERDLTVHVASVESSDEIGRLSRATAAMIDELRRLAGALQSSSRETSAMAGEIGASAEEMAASAQQMAETSSQLSEQSSQMAATIQHLASDATKLVGIAGELDAGAAEGVERNTRMRDLAAASRARLDDSAGTLGVLARDVEASAMAIEALAAGSEEIRAFVTFVQKMARQSKLLALNAAMEAARAGEQGQGFAVVASEVRRLAASAGEQAEHTEALVRDILDRVEASRTSSQRSVETARQVLDATRQSSESFGQIEQAVRDTETWTLAIRQASEGSGTLIREMTARLDSLAQGTESFAAAMQQVAASSEEQSASTQEIASAASHLAAAAERLLKLVATFRLEQGEQKQPALVAAD
jgi:methyl-accepting chemotaxis protein